MAALMTVAFHRGVQSIRLEVRADSNAPAAALYRKVREGEREGGERERERARESERPREKERESDRERERTSERARESGGARGMERDTIDR